MSDLRMQRVLGFISVIVLLCTGAVFATCIYLIPKTEMVAEERIETVEQSFRAVPSLSASEEGLLRTYLNPHHLAAARALGVPSVPTRAVADMLIHEGQLVRLSSNAYFVVEPMDFGVPYVTADMARLLELLGARFQTALQAAALPPYRLVITSATRSEEDQRRLRSRNINASPTSSHQFGTTVDLHYRRYYYEPDQDTTSHPQGILGWRLTERLETAYANLAQTHHEKLRAVLARVLIEMQEEGRVLVIGERRQPVFHVTVARPSV